MFPYLGNFANILPYDDIFHYTLFANWQEGFSASHEHKKSTRPQAEQDQSRYYNKHNSFRFSIEVRDQNFFPDSWFETIGASKIDYQAKIYKTPPGNAEPPHIDFFPSFIGHTDKQGNLYSQKEILALGKKIIRAWIPLQDSKLGHILFSDNFALTKWSVGDVYELPSGLVHGFVNAGREERLLLVFTGWRL